MADVRVRPAAAGDAVAVLSLLESSALPLDGVEAHLADFLVAEADGAVAGVAGLERYGDAALLRSVAVAPSSRGTGLGGLLTTTALESAAMGGARSIWLLTTTAEDYFPRYGFKRAARESVPVAVRESVEFTTACPATAAVMVLELEEATHG